MYVCFVFPLPAIIVPVRQTHVLGYPSGNNPFLFDRGLNKHVSGILARSVCLCF